MPAANATFTGIPTIRAAEFAFARGVSPSIFTLSCVPLDGIDSPLGTLTFSFGGNTIQFTDCAISAAFVHRRHDGKWPIERVHGFDRRWKWRFSNVSGDWNRRLSDGTVDTATAKSPAELAAALLSALGESGYDTSRMPSSVRPRALWRNQRADLALQTLCDSVACEVVLNHLTNKVEIWPSGLGITAPTGFSELLPKYRYVPRANIPSVVEVRGGDSLFQHKLKLSAVTRDYTTSNQKLIANSEFKPSTGWDKESPFSFPGVTSTNNRVLAFEDVWREFRVVGQQDGSVQPPNCPTPVSSIDQYQLTEALLEVEIDLEGYKRNLPCYLDGDYYAYTDLPNNTSSMRYSGSFVLSADRRMVRLPYPLFKLDSSGGFAEPTLYLTTSYRVKSTSGQTVSISRQGNIGGAGGKLILRRPELFAIYSSSTTPGAQTNTEAQANAEADSYISMFQAKYSNPNAAELTYPGFAPFTLDGNIAQITWAFGPGTTRFATTKVCEQEEADASAVPRKRRRLDQMIEQLWEAQA